MFLNGFLTLSNQGLHFFIHPVWKNFHFYKHRKSRQVQWELNQVITVSTLSGFHLLLVISEIADKVLSSYVSRLETIALHNSLHYYMFNVTCKC